MAIKVPANVRGPVLELTLPAAAFVVDIKLTNVTTGLSLTLNAPIAAKGWGLVLDFRLRTIVDLTGADQSALLSPEDRELWKEEPLVEGENDLEIEFSAAKSEAYVAKAVLRYQQGHY